MTNLHLPVGGDPNVPRPSFARGLEKANPWLTVIFNEQRKRRIRILIVADGNIKFSDADFGLSELIYKGILPSATPGEDLTVVTAHRSANESADIPGFRFDVTPPHPFCCPITPDHYEQVWLFGFNSEGEDPLSDAELAVLAAFMQAGGGVFANGDHLDLGAALCGEVPRVRSMRKWFRRDCTPDRNDETRLDTLREGIDPGFSADDQSDCVPQKIHPRFKQAEGCRSAEPHPLLARGSSAISILPDHMHEGECVVPTKLDRTFSFAGAEPADEFPLLPDVDKRLAPEVVAIAASAATGYLQGTTCFPPVEPRCFNVIVAYDGQRVGVGRVAVDASFHHFLNINLKGEVSGNPRRKGFYDAAGNPTPEYQIIKQYYRNLVVWLCPAKVRFEYYVRLLVALRYLSPLIEEIRPPKDPVCEDVIHAGGLTRNAISEKFSRVEATQCALALTGRLPEELRSLVGKLIDPWLPSALGGEKHFALFNTGMLTDVILGSAMLTLAGWLPANTCDVSEALMQKEAEGESLDSVVAANLARCVSLLAPTVDELGDAIRGLSAALNASV